MKRKITVSAFVVGVIFLGMNKLYGQGFPTYGPFVSTPEYEAARELFEEGYTAEPLAKFLALAAANPQTSLGATSLFSASQAANFAHDPPQELAILNRIITDYPHSRFEVEGKLMLIFRQQPDGSQELAEDRLAQSYGGPSVADILSKDRFALKQQMIALGPEIQEGLASVYLALYNNYFGTGRYDGGLKLALFNREMGYEDDILEILKLKRFGADYDGGEPPPHPILNPEIRLLSPRVSRVGGRPTLRIEITDGNFHQPQVDYSALKFQLDGQDLKPQTRVTSIFDKTFSEDKVFEKLKLTYRPKDRLTAGQHVLTLSAPVQGVYAQTGQGISTAEWRFVVGSDRDDDDDANNENSRDEE